MAAYTISIWIQTQWLGKLPDKRKNPIKLKTIFQLLGFPIDNCEAFAERYHEQMETPAYQKKFEHHKPLFQYLSEKTGMKVNNVYDVSELYFTFATEVRLTSHSIWKTIPIFSLRTDGNRA